MGVVEVELSCGVCGYTLRIDWESLGRRVVPARCPRCGAGESEVGCATGHVFGECAACVRREVPRQEV